MLLPQGCRGLGLSARNSAIRSRPLPGFIRLLLLLWTMCLSSLAYAGVQYAYDSAGRLVQVVADDGSVAIYHYDAAGNITSIERLSAGQLALTTFAPTAGAPGTQVTLNGSGFSTTAAANAVSFNGSAACGCHW